MNQFVINIIVLAPPILLALTLHEYAHGYVAHRFGDPTAKSLGRLTLNPLKHLDPLGTIAFFLIHIGWARPVPVNSAYFRDTKRDMLWVALAGPLTNLMLAIASALVAAGIAAMAPLLQGVLLVEMTAPFLFAMARASVWVNLVLCIFNFLPIPPLDGSRILMGLLPDGLARPYASFERYGFIVILLLAVTGILSSAILPVIRFADTLLLF